MDATTAQPEACTCCTEYIRKVRAGDPFTTGTATQPLRATADAEEYREPWMRASRGSRPVECDVLIAGRWDSVVIATDCPHSCFGGYVPEVTS